MEPISTVVISMSLFAVTLCLAGITFAIRKVYQELGEKTQTLKNIDESISKIENTFSEFVRQTKN